MNPAGNMILDLAGSGFTNLWLFYKGLRLSVLKTVRLVLQIRQAHWSFSAFMTVSILISAETAFVR